MLRVNIIQKPSFSLIRGKQKGVEIGFCVQILHKNNLPERCPLCHGKVRVIEDPYDDGRSIRDEITYYVKCDCCGLTDNGLFDNEYDAIKSWNDSVNDAKIGKDIGKRLVKVEFVKSEGDALYKRKFVGFKELKKRAKTKAKWIPTEDPNFVSCSNCENEVEVAPIEDDPERMNICDECGAKMKKLRMRGFVVKMLRSNGVYCITRKTKKQLCEERKKENET